MEMIKNAISYDIIITDDKQYAVGFLYDSSVYNAPIISIKINGCDLKESLKYFKSFNLSIFYNHYLAKELYDRYDLEDLLREYDYTVIAKRYAATPKFQPLIKK